MMTYIQETLFEMPETVEIEQEYRPTQEEINEYYRTHTLQETAKRFGCRKCKLCIPPELKKGRRGAGKVPDANTEVQVMFFKTFTKKSDLALAQILGVSNKTIAAIERRNKALKNLFEEYRVQIGNDYGEHLKETIGFIVKGMDAALAEALSKKKIKDASFKELTDGWTKLHSSIMECIPRENAVDSGDVDAKAQLLNAISNAVQAEEMDKATAESIYYQPEEKDGEDIETT